MSHAFKPVLMVAAAVAAFSASVPAVQGATGRARKSCRDSDRTE